MEKEIDIIDRIKNGRLEYLDDLSAPTKNKLFTVSQYSVQKKIGNLNLAKQLLNQMKLEDIYLNPLQRIKLTRTLYKNLEKIRDIPEGKQCKDELSKYINFERLLGAGSFGEVSIGSNNNIRFAVKMARQMKSPQSPEYHIAELMNRLVINNRVQNLPIMIDSYTCNLCTFNKVKTKNTNCVFSINEIATGGDMVGWLQKNPPVNELNSALFQIMAGIHALQYYYQIINNDIKAPNILIYNVNPGGYWKYTIYGRDFYVPNYGKLFIVNDFGVSEILSPPYKLPNEKMQNDIMKLGERAFIINNGQIEPLNNPLVKSNKFQKYDSIRFIWDNNLVTNINKNLFNVKTKKVLHNPVLTKTQKDLIGYDSTNLKFYDSPIVPPMDFTIDTQDAIRIFTGGKRMSQSQFHTKYNIDINFVNKLKKYILLKGFSYCSFISGTTNQTPASTKLSTMLAGYFILEYFTTEVIYTVPVHKDLIISTIKTS